MAKGSKIVTANVGKIGPSDDWDILLAEITNRSRPGAERKQDRSKRTEQQILTAALRVFARDGISRSRIADIAAESGISTSTLYEYYKSKEDLAYELPIKNLSAFFQSFRDTPTSEKTARERLVLYLTLSADYAREHADWARLFYLEIWPSVLVVDTEVQTSINDFARPVIKLLEEGIAEGWVSPKQNLYETAALIIGGSNQLIITWLLYRKPKNLTKAGSEMAERLVRLLEAEAKLDG